MFKDSKILIGTGVVLASAAVATVIVSPYLDDTVSPCFDNPVTAMMCRVEAPHMADRHENEPAPLQVQRTMAVAASTTASQLGMRTIGMLSMRGELTLTPSSA
jgi:hypothetical protein